MEECKHLTGRLAQICRGESGMPIDKVNQYRERWGLYPLPDDFAVSGSLGTTFSASSVSRPTSQSVTGCGGCGSKRKGFVSKVKRLAERTARIAEASLRHLQDDNKQSSSETVEFRESQCGACPLRSDKECSSCDCILYPNVLNSGKIRWRSESCPAGKWFRQTDLMRPLINPTRNMIFHIYPLIGAEWNWHRHIRFIESVSSMFNGKIAIGIVTGHDLASPETVMDLMKNVPVTDWVIKRNTKLAETLTFPDLLGIVKTDDPNSITFRGHTKGVTHRRTGVEEPWGKMMWATCMDIASVEDALASHVMAGPMKCHEPLVSKQRYKWFYAGTFFWFRNKEIFERDWETMEQTRWYPEAWPGVLCKNEEAACLCHDFTDGSVLSMQYWKDTVEPDYQLWKSARPNRTMEFE